MGSSHRLAAIAAASHARNYYNHTQSDVSQTEAPSHQYSVNVLFVSATLCGVLVAVCAACWRRNPYVDKPEETIECGGVYTVSGDDRLTQVEVDIHGPPPAYETVVTHNAVPKHCNLQEVVCESCPRCSTSNPQRSDTELPSYEAAVLLRDTKL